MRIPFSASIYLSPLDYLYMVWFEVPDE
jgi:hypothetical protein